LYKKYIFIECEALISILFIIMLLVFIDSVIGVVLTPECVPTVEGKTLAKNMKISRSKV